MEFSCNFNVVPPMLFGFWTIFPSWKANLIKITSYLQSNCDYSLETVIAEEQSPVRGQAAMAVK